MPVFEGGRIFFQAKSGWEEIEIRRTVEYTPSDPLFSVCR